MQPVDRFALDTHDGPCETWPSRTHVLVDGVRSALAVSGYVLLRQFETPAAYLLVTDYDCPFEEAVTFTLVSKDPMKVRARRTVGAMYASCRLDAEHPTAVVVVAPSKTYADRRGQGLVPRARRKQRVFALVGASP